MAYSKRHPDFGLTGTMAESEVLGETKNSIDFKKWREKNAPYMSHQEAMRLVKDSQPGDPTNPKPRFANDLHATVAGMVSPDDYEKVKYFTAVGSPLDYSHGVDAFFEIEHGGRTYVVTIDLKTYKPREDNLKVDVLLVYPKDGLDPIEDKPKYIDLLAETAVNVIEAFKMKVAANTGNTNPKRIRRYGR